MKAYYSTCYIENYAYIGSVINPSKNNEIKDLKIHLMFHTRYHLIILIMLMRIFFIKKINNTIKFNLSYYSSTISLPPHPENSAQKYIYELNYRGPLIVIYCNDIDGFERVLNALLECFDGLFHILGTNLTPSFNIKINELLYYSIGARLNKTTMVYDIKANCEKYKNYARFSSPGLDIWNNCSSQDSEDKCSAYSSDPQNTRLTNGEPMCRYTEDKCIPKPLSTCLKDDKTNQTIFINNRENYDTHKDKCTDDLCMQELHFNSYNKIKKMQEDAGESIDEHPNVQAGYDPQFVIDIEAKLRDILRSHESKKKTHTEEKEAAPSAHQKKYLKYKLKYLKNKNRL
jgi:hypothetical protein